MLLRTWEVITGVARYPTEQLYLHNLSPQGACIPTPFHRTWGDVRAQMRTFLRVGSTRVANLSRC